MYRCQFDAYGNLVEEDIATHWKTGERLIGIRNPLRFQGQYEDEESGLFYNLNRYYQPGLGQYITPDPIRLAGGLSGYQYGEEVYRCQFDACGNLVEEETATHWQTGERLISIRNPLRFQGQYEDEESGLFYNLNRYQLGIYKVIVLPRITGKGVNIDFSGR